MEQHELGIIRLYHGSDVPIEHPDVAHNSGYADLGKGFYLTDDLGAARRRAASRARRTGAAAGIVSVFELDERCVPWVVQGAGGAGHSASAPDVASAARAETQGCPEAFGLRFELDAPGLAAWGRYIQACRRGNTALPGRGSPAIVRAWIATEAVEMACSGLVPFEDLAEVVEASELIVQYCLLDQALIDSQLVFIASERVDVS